jgi:hypothetical protein
MFHVKQMKGVNQMSSYTMQLRTYIDQATQDNDTLSTRDRIESGRTKLFDFDYPLFDPNYKKAFETNFIRNFYMTEIGFETESLFKFKLENWLNINMGYFNKLFESELIQFDPLKNTVVDETHTKTDNRTQTDTRNTDTTGNITGTGDSNGTQHATNNTDSTSNITENVTDDNFNRQLESDTPESRLAITTNDGTGVIEYASKINEDNTNNKRDISKDETLSNDSTMDGNSTNHSTMNQDSTGNIKDDFTSTIDNTEDYAKNIIGKVGTQSYSKMIMEFRETFLRIEKKIFDEIRKELFMIVY